MDNSISGIVVAQILLTMAIIYLPGGALTLAVPNEITFPRARSAILNENVRYLKGRAAVANAVLFVSRQTGDGLGVMTYTSTKEMYWLYADKMPVRTDYLTFWEAIGIDRETFMSELSRAATE